MELNLTKKQLHVLYINRNYTAPEIAKQYNLPTSTVKSQLKKHRIARGRKVRTVSKLNRTSVHDNKIALLKLDDLTPKFTPPPCTREKINQAIWDARRDVEQYQKWSS